MSEIEKFFPSENGAGELAISGAPSSTLPESFEGANHRYVPVNVT
jgi:hypothetical protein